MKTQNSDNLDRILQIIKYLNLKKIIHQHPKFFIFSLGLSLFAFLIFITFKLTDIGNKIDNLNANKLSDEQKIQTQFRANNKKKQILSYGGENKEYLFLSYLSLSSIQEGGNWKYNATLWEMAGFEKGEFKVDLQEKITQQYQTILGYSVNLSAFIHKVAKEGKKCVYLEIDNDLLKKDEKHINSSFKNASIKGLDKYCGNFKHKINSIIACAVPNEKQTKAVGLIILSFAEPILNAKTIGELQKFCNAPASIEHEYCFNSSNCVRQSNAYKTYIDLFLEDMEIFTKELIQASY